MVPTFHRAKSILVPLARLNGCERTLRHQIAMGNYCGANCALPVGRLSTRRNCLSLVSYAATGTYLELIAQTVVSSGKAWISTTRLDAETKVLRTCVTIIARRPEEVVSLVKVPGAAWRI